MERSTDGVNWDEIAQIKGNGTVSETSHYQYSDDSYRKVLNYYRLTQVDFDGKSKVHNVVTIDNRTQNRKLLKVVNMLGQEIDPNTAGQVIEIYDDGTIERTVRP